MKLGVLTDPAPNIRDMEHMLSWSRLAEGHVGPKTLIRDARAMFQRGLTNQEAVHLIYELGGVMNASKIYPVPKDRFAIRNFTLESALAWLDNDFDPKASFSPTSVGKLYAGFAHLGARLPKKIHQYLRDKVREHADAFLSKDGPRIIEYYATTADHIPTSVFEIAVKSVEQDPSEMHRSRQVGFLNHIAILDSMYDSTHSTPGYDPKSIFFRNFHAFEAINAEIDLGRVDNAKRWFAGENLYLNGDGLKHMLHIQETAAKLEALGFEIHTDFKSAAARHPTDGIDFKIGKPSSNVRVSIIYDTAVKYIECIASPRILVPSGRTIFNSSAVQRLHPDSVVLRLSTVAMNQFGRNEVKEAVEQAFAAPPNVYGLDERAQLQPIRKLTFRS